MLLSRLIVFNFRVISSVTYSYTAGGITYQYIIALSGPSALESNSTASGAWTALYSVATTDTVNTVFTVVSITINTGAVTCAAGMCSNMTMQFTPGCAMCVVGSGAACLSCGSGNPTASGFCAMCNAGYYLASATATTCTGTFSTLMLVMCMSSLN